MALFILEDAYSSIKTAISLYVLKRIFNRLVCENSRSISVVVFHQFYSFVGYLVSTIKEFLTVALYVSLKWKGPPLMTKPTPFSLRVTSLSWVNKERSVVELLARCMDPSVFELNLFRPFHHFHKKVPSAKYHLLHCKKLMLS